MAKVNFQINGLEIDDAVTLIIGFNAGILQKVANTEIQENEFIKKFVDSLDKIQNDCIEAVGASEFEKIYAEVYTAVAGIVTPALTDKSKLN